MHHHPVYLNFDEHLVVKIVNCIVTQAYKERASGIQAVQPTRACRYQADFNVAIVGNIDANSFKMVVVAAANGATGCPFYFIDHELSIEHAKLVADV